MATVRRKENNYPGMVLTLAFLALYLWLAQMMEGLNFDTIFIAFFCTLLSAFIIRCIQGFITGR